MVERTSPREYSPGPGVLADIGAYSVLARNEKAGGFGFMLKMLGVYPAGPGVETAGPSWALSFPCISAGLVARGFSGR